MEDTVDYFCWQIPDLKKYLQARGIQCSLGRKIELVRLCELADELKLEIVKLPDEENEKEYADFDQFRRSVTIVSERVILKPMNKINDWNIDLSKIPDVASFDVLIYIVPHE